MYFALFAYYYVCAQVTIAPPTFPRLFQRDINLHRSTAILQATKRLIQANSIQEPVNKVKKCAARGKRSDRDGEAYGKSDMSMM